MNKTFALILFLFFGVAAGTWCQGSIPPGISQAIKAGNAKELVKFMNDNVEMVILDKEGIYSKSQAEMILKDFFSKNQPKKFSLMHQGGKAESKYGIGDLSTGIESFRIYFLLKTTNGKSLIHQFRIEKENE